MALPTLDAVFASAADLPRRYMLAQWLVGEKEETQGSSSVLVSGAGEGAANGTYTYRGEESGKPYYNLVGEANGIGESSIYWDGTQWTISDNGFYVSSEDTEFPWLVTTWQFLNGEEPAPTVTEIPAASPISNYYTLPERYLWAKIAVAAGAPRSEADYISLPKQYVWKAIYDAVSGSSLGTIDWTEKQALGHIAAAYRGDTGNPANLATYIDWPWRYQVASIIGALNTPTDPYFSNVSLLLHMDGNQDSQTFTDSSNNNFTITALGDAKIDTAIKKIGTGSAKLDGNGDSCIASDNILLDLGSTWTMEWWVYFNTLAGSQTMLSKSGFVVLPFGFYVTKNAINNYLTIGNGTAVTQFDASITSENTWYHIAIASDATENKTYFFLNGSLTKTNNTSTTLTDNSSVLRIGALTVSGGGNPEYLNGYIDELRITKDVCRYTSNFTPPESEFPNQ
jgi:hypothetical protein